MRGFHAVKKSNLTAQSGLISKDLRRRKGLTLDQIADAAELSKGHLSRFERGEKALSVASMLRLAQALNTTVGRLLGEEFDKDGIRVVKAKDASSVSVNNETDSYIYRTLSGPESAEQVHTSIVMNIPENGTQTSESFHGGRELLYVLSGGIRVELADQIIELDRGDYLEFPGHIPHSIVNLANPSSILLIIINADHLKRKNMT
ncbi:MAG: transcriptional regulator with XRE-family HTH domain [Hyphomicrobiaceae bacterium]